MSKRRADDDSDIDVSSTEESDAEISSHDSTSSEGVAEGEEINVDFDYFDLNPAVDFHPTKTFLRQLFGGDAFQFDVSGLADLILAENAVGTTIKTEGPEGDPYALLTVLDASAHRGRPCLKAVLDYLVEKTKPSPELNMILSKLFGLRDSTKDPSKQLRVGIIISERMINMPVEVAPPMYKMFVSELAADTNENPFDYFLVVSKIYRMVAAETGTDSVPLQKRAKSKPEPGADLDYFHYEDMVLEANSKYHFHYEFTRKLQDSDSRGVFTEYGIEPLLKLILLDKKGLEKSVPEMEEKFPPY